jgi:hypothetical protein
MIAVYGARIDEAEVQTIVSYLAAEYGAAPKAETGEMPILRAGQPSPSRRRVRQ